MYNVFQAAVSIVIPLHNEADNVATLAFEIERAMAPSDMNWECIWVDDASNDGTSDRVESLLGPDSRHRLITLVNQQGQSAALAAGFARATMPLVAMLDGDGQNDPADLPGMITTLLKLELDVVNGYRVRRFSTFRRLTSRIANGFRNRVTGDSVRDVGCSIRVMRAEYLHALPVFKGMHRFLPTLIRVAGGTRQIQVPVAHRMRQAGTTNYGTWDRLWVGIADTFGVRWWSKRSVRPAVSHAAQNVEESLHDVNVKPVKEASGE